MAPINAGDVSAWPWASAIEEEREQSIRPPRHQQEILQMIALAAACTSFLSAMMAIYWFLMMRRNFRHNLILFMILSDSTKAIIYIVFPIVQFIMGTVPPSSAFCQATGFFLALGIEGTDFAVLVIAAHTALCVFRSGRSSKESGLYKHRYIIYSLWIALPTILASLAFANTGNAYMPQGTSCYLPVRPLWYRLALSWVPRYLTFFTILAVYSAIFLWVRYHFNKLEFGTNDSYVGEDTEGTTFDGEQGMGLDLGHRVSVRHSEQDSTIELQIRRANGVLPATPRLSRHGHIPSDGSSRSNVRSREHHVASALRQSIPIRIKNLRSTQSSNLDRGSAIHVSDPFISELKAEREKSKLTVPELAHQPSLDRDSGIGSISEGSSPYDDSSVVGILDALRDPQAKPLPKPRRAASTTPRPSKSRTIDTSATKQIRKRQRAINRQLRLVFVYPVTYCLVWFIPFVNHCLQYSDNYLARPPFAFLCVSGFCLAFQTAIYSWLFSVREKPWKHILGSDGTILGSLMFWNHVSTGQVSHWRPRRRQNSQGSTSGGGWSDNVQETTLAYQRREAERSEALEGQKAKIKVNGGVQDPREVNWWDCEDHFIHGDHGLASPAMIITHGGPQGSRNVGMREGLPRRPPLKSSMKVVEARAQSGS